MNSHTLSLYITAAHACGYYSDRDAMNLVPDPQVRMQIPLYDLLVSKGFRRSGDYVYRPHCPQCHACVPCRIDVTRYRPNRNQRRCLKHNQDVITRVGPAVLTDEYFDLYRRYINSRHGDGSMANPEPEDYSRFLMTSWGKTLFIETRLQQRLLGVAVCDFLDSGLSAVYTFFDPDEASRSLGTLGILQQIWLAQVYRRRYIYLGYWIRNHPKMDYKRHFSGLELFLDDAWQKSASDA
ncbi:MAG: arginyltransferase [Gammaproteobacteria bacterium]|nr:MAG: arginyltransferase [Gammaproteobacteria bacterium]